MIEQPRKREKLSRKVMIRLTEAQYEIISKEGFDRDISTSLVIREAMRSGRPDLFVRDLVNGEKTTDRLGTKVA